jgi:nicotinate-nucleotide pyrophosphorylase (carboxylating)
LVSLKDDERQTIRPTVAAALAEDVGSGDLTAALIDEDAIVGATIIAREPLVLAGHPWATEVFRQLDERIQVDWYVEDGQHAETDDVICKLVGPARTLLTGERTALNFLQTLSGTATVTARYVAAVAGTRARVLDTRKTLPGLRRAQKYAVRCGGGHNHRTGLYDAILIKENHVKSAGSITEALRRAQGAASDVLIEVEVESLDELREALDAGAGRILLDNFSLDDMRDAVRINADYGYVAAELEASGNVSLETIRDIAETGVDYISTGAITKNVRAIDLSMLFRID